MLDFLSNQWLVGKLTVISNKLIIVLISEVIQQITAVMKQKRQEVTVQSRTHNANLQQLSYASINSGSNFV